MSTKKERFESLKKTIYALLVPYKNGCTIKQLTQDYYDVQGESIPFEKLGYGSLINLLRDMNDTVYTEFNSGKHFFKCIPSSNSAHLTALVAGQKTDPRKEKYMRKQFRPSPYYPNVPVPPVHLPVEVMSAIIDLVSKHPKGMHKSEVLQLIHKKMPGAFITVQDMDEQLKQISHQVLVRGSYVYYINKPKNSSLESPALLSNQPIPDTTNIYVGGCENPEELYYYDDEDDFKFLPAGCPSSASKKTSSGPRKPISCFIQDTLLNNQDHVVNERIKNTSQERKDDSEQYSCNVDKEYHKVNTTDINTVDDEESHYLSCKNTELLISDRVKFRLEKLIEKYPDGIWCAELPDKYLEEYKVSLYYVELGFSSVREFASHLPNIFHCVSSNGIGDYKLYSAKSSIPSHINNKPVIPKLMDLHTTASNIWDNETDVLPSIASTATCKELIPDDVMTIGECVALISVESLAHMDDQYLEVVVVEVFTPSFFWIQLRKNKKPFRAFMNELHRFYEIEGSNYEIPSVVLEKGLNCACTYNGLWHRGIIKTVNPDLLVTVFFYDYGTLKTYPASHLRYLHRSFSHLPAQAVPCGLVNTKPYSGTRWTRSVTNQFASKTCNIPLVATISAINEEDNSLMVTLTDTSDEEDLHINDWMVEKKLALHGKMVCIKCRNFLFAYYLRCRENLRKLIDDYGKRSKNVKCNNHAKHKHIVAASVPLNEKTCPNKADNFIYNTKAPSTDLKTFLSTARKSGTRISEIDRSVISINTSVDENARSNNRSSSSISSNPKFHKKASTRFQKIVSLMELSQTSEKSSTLESTTSSKKNGPCLRPSDVEQLDRISNKSTNKTKGRQPDSAESKNTSNEDHVKTSPFPPNIHSSSTWDDDDNQETVCFGTCGGKCKKGHQIELVNWSELLAETEKINPAEFTVPVEKCEKNKEKCADSKEQPRSITALDNYFLQAVQSGSHITSTGGNIYWTNSGNIVNNDCDNSAVLKKIRNVIDKFEGNYIAMTQEEFEKLSTSVDLQKETTSESVSSHGTQKHIDGSGDSSNEEIKSLSEKSDFQYEETSNSQDTEGRDLFECNNDLQKCELNEKVNQNGRCSREEGIEESSDSLSSISTSAERLGVFPAIISDAPVAPDTTSSESQQDEKDSVDADLSSDIEEVKKLNQNVNEDFHTTTGLCTNYYMHLQANTAKSRILQMLMKTCNLSKDCDSLDSDDCSDSDHDKDTSELIKQVQQMEQKNSYEISERGVQEILRNSHVDDIPDECDNELEPLSHANFETKVDSMVHKGDKLEVEILDGSECIQNAIAAVTKESSSIPSEFSSNIPVFNDLDMQSDSDEFDVQIKLSDFYKNENVEKHFPCIEN